jgi:CRP-like cAMP-binding protein
MIAPQALQRYSLFGGLLEEEIQKILPLLEKETYKEGDSIIVMGERNDRIRLIIEGRVEVRKGETLLAEFKEGDAFGEMEVLDMMTSAATIRALSGVTVMSISNKTLHRIYKDDLKTFSLFIMNLARDLSRRLRRMDDMVTCQEHVHPGLPD